jgi:D-xylose transport system substrate-binding protein
MKTYLKIALLILIGLSINACKQHGDVTIGFLIPATEGHRWPIDQGYVEEAASKVNAKVITLSAENDENLQIRLGENLLEMGVDVLIVVSVNSNTSAAIVRAAHQKNVPVIAYDRLIRNTDLDYFVTFDGHQIGSLMVNHALSEVPKGNYVLLYGDAGDVNALTIKEAQEEILKPHVERGDVNIVFKGFCDNWAGDNAYHKMKQVLTFTDQKIDAVITSYDGLAIGALKAINEFPDHDVKVLTGQDAEIAAVRAVARDEMSLTVYKSIAEIANASVDLAVKLARKERIASSGETVNNGRKDVPALLLEPVAVTKNNIRSTVVADGFLSEDAIYGDD